MNDKDFITKWIQKVESKLKKFPDEFLANFETENFQMPGKTVALGSELFGQFEIVDLNGNPIVQTDDYNFIKFILYANRLKPQTILKPKNPSDIKLVVKDYEFLLDSIVKEIKAELNKVLPNSDFLRISNQIFNALNLQRY